MRTIGNILWFVLGGFFMGLGWWLAGLLCAITIVGLPWAKACFVIGQFAFLPFGKEAVNRAVVTGEHDIGTGMLGTIGNGLAAALQHERERDGVAEREATAQRPQHRQARHGHRRRHVMRLPSGGVFARVDAPTLVATDAGSASM